jgi:integrase
MRLKVKGQKRQYVDLTDLFPNDAADVAAAKAKDLARRGLLVNGKVIVTTTDVRLTLAQVIDRVGHTRTYWNVLKTIDVNGVPLGSRIMADITGDDLERAADAQQAKAKNHAHGGLSARRHLLANARYLWNWAIKQRILKATPFKESGVAMITVGQSRARSRRLVGDEESRLLAAASPWLHDLVTAALETGCRLSELLKLQWSEIQDDWLLLQAHKTKTKRARRLPVSPTLRAILDRRRKGPDGNDVSEDSHVFGDETGKLISRRLAHRYWKAACTKAKIDGLRFHDLRHEMGSQTLEAGASLHEVQAILGHTTLAMTGRYLNATEKGVGEAFKKLEAKRRRAKLKIV